MTKVVIIRIIALLQINVCNATLFNEIKHGYINFFIFYKKIFMKTQESLQSLMNKILKTGTRFQKLKITTAEM